MGILHVAPGPPRTGAAVGLPRCPSPAERRHRAGELRPRERAMLTLRIVPGTPVFATPDRNSRGISPRAVEGLPIAAAGRAIYSARPRSDARARDPLADLTLRDEAHLPAQEAQARPHARLPRPHADPQRPRGHQAPPPQGPQAPDPVDSGSGGAWRAKREPGRRGRLSRSGDFDRAYRDGRSQRQPLPGPLRVPAPGRRGRGRSPGRVGEPQGRRRGAAKQGQARPSRGVLGARRASCPPTHDFVLVARPDLPGLVEREGAQGVRARARGPCDARAA